MYITEYAAIRIDFILRGYTLDPLESPPASGESTDVETPVY